MKKYTYQELHEDSRCGLLSYTIDQYMEQNDLQDISYGELAYIEDYLNEKGRVFDDQGYEV